jgi:hypothetical protein
MTRPPSSIYSVPHRDSRRQIENTISRGCHHSTGSSQIFFRADDIGIPSRQFRLLIDCFIKHRIPLCLATVPSWLTPKRFAELKQLTGADSSQWCWHQHGRLHHNFEPSGKKQEFGPSRPAKEIRNSLKKGKQRLEEIMADEFQPIFTPPWNRCSRTTIDALVKLGFSALSRSRRAQPETVPELPDFQVGVDLHTRKETSPRLGFENLLIELEENIRSRQCGIMIHHQRMNNRAFELLDLLLAIINDSPRLTPVLFGDLFL